MSEQIITTDVTAPQLEECIKLSVKSKRPLFIWGPPGAGKTSIVSQVADSLLHKLIDERPAQRDPVDYRGVPYIVDGKAIWTRPDFLPDENDTGKYICSLEELSAAPPANQVVLYQVLLERRLGSYKVPDGVAFVATGNRETDRAVAGRMSTALANRFWHVTLIVDMQAWCVWALQNGIRPETVAFIRLRPELLHKFDPTKSDEKAFPTPRSWHIVSDLQEAGIDPSIEFSAIAGTIGKGAAAEYLGFLRIYRQLVSPDVILLDPLGADIPDNPSALYAVCSALARRASPNTIDRIIQYADRLREEFSVMTVKDCALRNKACLSSAGFTQWAIAHPDVMF